MIWRERCGVFSSATSDESSQFTVPWRSPAPARSALFLKFVLRDTRLDQLFHKNGRHRLVHGEADGPFGGLEVLEFVLERLDHGRTREQTAVVRKRGEPHQQSFVLERRNLIADGFGSLRWHSGANRRANLVQGAAGGFRDAGEVFVHALGSDVAFRGRTASAGTCFFHSDNPPRTFPSILPISRQRVRATASRTVCRPPRLAASRAR